MSKSIVIAGRVLLMCASAAPPVGAMTDNETVTAHVPFAFHVGATFMPAGDYTLKSVDICAPTVIEIRGTNPIGPVAIFLGVPRDGSRGAQPELVFDDVGKEKFLRAVLLPNQTGVELPDTRAELAAARELAARSRPTPTPAD
jgi:hypothetical protein